MVLKALVPFTIVAVAGCGSDQDGAFLYERFDSADIEIVRTSAPSSSGLPSWRLEAGTPVTLDYPGHVEYRLLSAAFFGDGGVVATNQEQELLVFSADGTPEGVIGRKGEGPGEFLSLYSVSAFGDTVVTFDRYNRVAFFHRSGDFLGSGLLPFPVSLPAGVRATNGQHFFAKKEELPTAEMQSGNSSELIEGRAHFLRFTLEDGSFGTDTVLTLPGITWMKIGAGSIVDRPIYPSPHFSVNDNGVVMGWSGEPQLWEFNQRGELIRIIEVHLPQMEFGSAERSRWCEPSEPGATPCTFRKADGSLTDLVFPEHNPFFAGLMLSSDGWLWLRRMPDGPADPNQLWWILDPTRRIVAEVKFRSNYSIVDAVGDVVLGVSTDDLGVETLVLTTVVR